MEKSASPIKSPGKNLLSVYFKHVNCCNEYLLACNIDNKSLAELNMNREVEKLLRSVIICHNRTPKQYRHQITRSPGCSQAEIVHIVIGNLFKQAKGEPRNMITHGYTWRNDRTFVSDIGGTGQDLVNTFPNPYVSFLKSSVWEEILSVVGDEMMIEMLGSTSMFISLENDNFYQIVGTPLVEQKKYETVGTLKRRRTLSPLREDSGLIQISPKKLRRFDKSSPERSLSAVNSTRPVHLSRQPKLRTPHNIVFVRSRIYYARPAVNGQGKVTFGLRHIHILNRGVKLPPAIRLSNLLMYVFPLQYGLHNVFNSEVDRKETIQPFKDYTLREDTILFSKSKRARTPKRLRGSIQKLLLQFQNKHSRLPYHQYLDQYCPVLGPIESEVELTATASSRNSSDKFKTQPRDHSLNDVSAISSLSKLRALNERKETLTDFASSYTKVFSFVEHILRAIIPAEIFGTEHNFHAFLQTVQKIVSLRRYESVSLQEAIFGLKITHIPWLAKSIQQKTCSSDFAKRSELFSELIYWLIDSYVLPLLRAHFYVTESHVFRNRVLFFRHDVWRKLTEPELSRIKLTMLREIPSYTALEYLKNRALGFSYMRLLPKGSGARPITNLRRRELKVTTYENRGSTYRRKYLVPSINSTMGSVYQALSYERDRDSSQLGFSIQSINDIHAKLKLYKSHLAQTRSRGKLYFAKVDVTNCFDTIDQTKVMDIVSRVLSEDEYMMQKYSVLAPSLGKLGKKFLTRAVPADSFQPFSDFAEKLANRKRHTIMVDQVVHTYKEKEFLLSLLKDHLMMHLIKINNRYYAQESGIPQGSILSTILCNYYYADMERNVLSFMNDEDSLCFRLIDDFLFITPDKNLAMRFLEVMHEGQADYGCFVNAAKSLTNFDAIVHDTKVNQIVGSTDFPYCGTMINTISLNVKKDFARASNLLIADTLSVEYTSTPGRAIMAKIFQGMKLNCHPIYIDTSLNSMYTVLVNLYQSFVFAAMRYYAYIRELQDRSLGLIEKTTKFVSELNGLVFTFLQSRAQTSPGVQCSVSEPFLSWLGLHAFRTILRRKPARFAQTIRELEQRLGETMTQGRMSNVLHKVTASRNVHCFDAYNY